MGRIRTIKPEFPQSESMGRVSRDARLTFIQLWTLADDSGRLRGNSRMLASLLFPYDDDASRLIDGWLSELEREGCIVRYKVESDAYIAIAKWLSHQKIDKPSPSKNPAPEDGSRILANPRESSPLDQGPRTEGPKDHGEDKGMDLVPSEAKASGEIAQPSARPKPTTPDEIIFGYGVPLLTTAGTAEKQARSFLGGLRKSHGDEAVVNALRECIRAKPLQPLEWLAGALKPKVAGKQTAIESRNAALVARLIKEADRAAE